MPIYNNPGNIEPNQWAGDTGKRYAGRFVVFDSPEMGVRAMMRDARKKVADYNGDIDAIINKYAPPSENDTKAYADFVKKNVGKKKITDEDVPSLVEAIIRFENKPDVADYYLQPDIMKKAYELSKISLPEGYTYDQANKDFGIDAAYDSNVVQPDELKGEKSFFDRLFGSL